MRYCYSFYKFKTLQESYIIKSNYFYKIFFKNNELIFILIINIKKNSSNYMFLYIFYKRFNNYINIKYN